MLMLMLLMTCAALFFIKKTRRQMKKKRTRLVSLIVQQAPHMYNCSPGAFLSWRVFQSTSWHKYVGKMQQSARFFFLEAFFISGHGLLSGLLLWAVAPEKKLLHLFIL